MATDPLLGTYSVYSEEILPIQNRFDSTGIRAILTASWLSRIAVDSIIVCNPSAAELQRTCAKALIQVLAPPPSITANHPTTLETYINGEPMKDDTLKFIGTNLDGAVSVLWNNTLTLRIIAASSDTLAVFVPDSLHRMRGNVPVRFLTADSLSSRAFVTLAYPAAQIDSIRPDTIEVPLNLSMAALKDDASLSSGNDRRNEFPVIPGMLIEPIFFPNAPNPFDQSTTIEYALPHDATVSIKVIDALGRKIADLVEQKFHPAGAYSVQWTPPNSYGSGVYTAVLQSMDAKGKMTQKTLRMTRIR